MKAIAALAALCAASMLGFPAQAQEGIPIPAPATQSLEPSAAKETAVFAGGCFWGVQGIFQHTKGVSNAVSGYSGGDENTAVYEIVGSGLTGHAEAVKITYDPHVISYGKLMQVFFSVAHDPTQLNRQGPDRGTQYRTTIFPQDAAQEREARAYIAQLDQAKVYSTAIATTIEPGKVFYPAEAYHQDFLTLNPTYPYIVYNDLPKLEKLKALFPDLYRADPALVSEASMSN